MLFRSQTPPTPVLPYPELKELHGLYIHHCIQPVFLSYIKLVFKFQTEFTC